MKLIMLSLFVGAASYSSLLLSARNGSIALRSTALGLFFVLLILTVVSAAYVLHKYIQLKKLTCLLFCTVAVPLVLVFLVVPLTAKNVDMRDSRFRQRLADYDKAASVLMSETSSDNPRGYYVHNRYQELAEEIFVERDNDGHIRIYFLEKSTWLNRGPNGYCFDPSDTNKRGRKLQPRWYAL